MEEKSPYPMRINKYLAFKGYSTRKGGDTLVSKGLVSINGKRAQLGDQVKEGDKVEVRGTKKTYHYYAYNKPRGIITHSPQGDEESIEQTVPLKGVFPVGRLDKDSYGLIILTDDGRITDKLLNPAYVHEKEYKVSVKSDLPSNFKKRMEAGVLIEGYKTKPAMVRIHGEKSFSVVLTEGKKHQIRRMCSALKVDVAKLERTRIMNIKLLSTKAGQYREITGKELERFLAPLGLQ